MNDERLLNGSTAFSDKSSYRLQIDHIHMRCLYFRTWWRDGAIEVHGLGESWFDSAMV